jgi:hypothetical protein
MKRPAPPKLKITQPKPAPKPKPYVPQGPGGYDQNGKPAPGGLYSKDGFMTVVPGKAPKVTITKKEQERLDSEAARKAGYKK